MLARTPAEEKGHRQPSCHQSRVYTRPSMSGFSFAVEARDGRARAGLAPDAPRRGRDARLHARRHAGAVKAVLHRELREIGAAILLANTYHLMLRPGDELVARLGGLHRFMGWDGPFLTDSGGYQVFSLADLRKLDEDGRALPSHIDGSAPPARRPERSIEIQERARGRHRDGVRRVPAARRAARGASREATARTTRWARRSRAAHRARPDQALFGIVQGGVVPDLRERERARSCWRSDFPGYAIGGLSVGEPKPSSRARCSTRPRPAPARGPAALPDGRRARPRTCRRGGAGRRHVRLRAADPQRPQRPALHARRAALDQERPLPRRPRARPTPSAPAPPAGA